MERSDGSGLCVGASILVEYIRKLSDQILKQSSFCSSFYRSLISRLFFREHKQINFMVYWCIQVFQGPITRPQNHRYLVSTHGIAM